jgi:zinc transport system substrate-binding protein
MRVRIVLIFVASLAMTACGSSGAKGGKQIVAAFYPLAFAVEEIDPGASVRNLTPPGAEPHDLEVSPGDVQELRSAEVVLLLGHGFQPQLEQAAGTGKNVLLLLDTPGLRLRPGDPHVWLDPLLYALIVRRIGAVLGRPHAAARLVARLHALDREYRAGLTRCARREIVTSHEAFGYLAERYGLQQVAITGLSPEAEPTPQRLAGVIATVRRTHATTVFFETLVSPRLADTVARETGAKTAVLDPIEGLTGEEQQAGADYFSLMRSNLTTLRKALGCS